MEALVTEPYSVTSHFRHISAADNQRCFLRTDCRWSAIYMKKKSAWLPASSWTQLFSLTSIMRKRVLFCSRSFIAYAYRYLPPSYDALLLKKKGFILLTHTHAQSSIYLCPIIACSIVWECDERFISRAGQKCRKWMQRHAPADACSHAHKHTGLTAKSWCHLSFFTFFCTVHRQIWLSFFKYARWTKMHAHVWGGISENDSLSLQSQIFSYGSL